MRSYNENLTAVLLSHFAAAEKSISLCAPMLSEPSLLRALCDYARKGLQIRLLFVEQNAQAQFFAENENPLNAGAEVYYVSFISDKFCLIDRKTVIFGSYSWGKEDERVFESLLVSENVETVRNFMLVFEKNLAQGTRDEYYTLWDTSEIIRNEIRNLENDCAFLEIQIREISDFYAQIEDFLRVKLGDLMLKRLELLAERARKFAEKFKKHSYKDEHQQRQREAENLRDFFRKTEKIANPEVPKPKNQDVSLKEIYHRLVRQAHPDKFADNETLRLKAEELMRKINRAYEDNDRETLLEIENALANGLLGNTDFSTISADKLQKMLIFWREKKQTLLDELNALKNNDFFAIFRKQTSPEEYAEKLRIILQKEIRELERESGGVR